VPEYRGPNDATRLARLVEELQLDPAYAEEIAAFGAGS
jgi:hypothetical protein